MPALTALISFYLRLHDICRNEGFETHRNESELETLLPVHVLTHSLFNHSVHSQGLHPIFLAISLLFTYIHCNLNNNILVMGEVTSSGLNYCSCSFTTNK